MNGCVEGWDDWDADYQIHACLTHGCSWSECKERNRFVTVNDDGSVVCAHCGRGSGDGYTEGTCDLCGPFVESALSGAAEEGL